MVHASAIAESIIAPTLFRPEFSHGLDPKAASKRSGNTETDNVHAVDGCGPVAVPGVENPSTVAPGTAAKDTETIRCI